MASKRILDDKINTLNRIASAIYPNNRYTDFAKKVAVSYEQMKIADRIYTDVDAYMYAFPGHRPPSINSKTSSVTSEILVYGFFRWIKSKLVYFFDPDVERQFAGLDIDDLLAMPLSVLNRLPASEFFVAVDPGAYDWHDDDGNAPIGFLFVLDRNYSCGNMLDRSSAGFQIILVFDYSEQGDNAHVDYRPLAYMGVKFTTAVPMTFGTLMTMNIDEIHQKSKDWRRGITVDEDTWNTGIAQTDSLYYDVLTHTLPYILYLCSENAELQDDSEKTYRPWTLEPKHKYREVDQIACGTELGKRIRSFKNNSSVVYTSGRTGKGRSKAPHHRRAHFHKFWVGSGENKHVVIKWLQEMYIHKDAQVIVTGVRV